MLQQGLQLLQEAHLAQLVSLIYDQVLQSSDGTKSLRQLCQLHGICNEDLSRSEEGVELLLVCGKKGFSQEFDARDQVLPGVFGASVRENEKFLVKLDGELTGGAQHDGFEAITLFNHV